MKRTARARLLAAALALPCSFAACNAEDLGMGEGPGDPAAPGDPPPPVSGFADLHFHMTAEEAHGGGWLHGRLDGPGALDDCDGGLPPSDHARVRQDLSALIKHCPQTQLLDEVLADLGTILTGTVGGVFGSEVIGKNNATDGDTGLHLGRRASPEGWPRWDTVAHQQAYQGWLEDAHRRGLNLVVLSTVSYDWLCQIIPEANRRAACDEMQDVELQLDMAAAFAARHSDWVEIARSPSEARRIIGAGKLAVVLSIEASHLFGRDVSPANLAARIERVYQKGVRTFQLVHQTDNPFAGAAHHNAIFQFAQFTENCFIDTDCGVTTSRFTLGFDVDGACRNTRGLTPLGRALVGEMISRKMPIDVAHMSERGVADVYDLAVQSDYYPMYVSHGHFREVMPPQVARTEKSTPKEIVRMLRRTGGMFGLRTMHDETLRYERTPIENSCHGSSRSFAQAYEFGRLGLKVPMAFGADVNGFIQQTRPRFGALGACSASFKAEADCQVKAQRQAGPAKLGTDFDEKGLAHEGLLPDLVEELTRLGADPAPLRSSAEAYLRMWERASGPRAGMADPAEDLDTGGVAPFVEHKVREDKFPKRCNLAYCPAYQVVGGECRFDAECESGRCSAVLCGAAPGKCQAP